MLFQLSGCSSLTSSGSSLIDRKVNCLSTISMPIKETPWLRQLDEGQDRLVLVADFPRKVPKVLFGFWIEPAFLSKWWPPEVELIEPRPNGRYVLRWPKQNWCFRSRFTEFEPEKNLEFIWSWDHELNANPTKVRLTFEPIDHEGTRMILVHGSYGPNNAEQRQSHLEGWIFFFPSYIQFRSYIRMCNLQVTLFFRILP